MQITKTYVLYTIEDYIDHIDVVLGLHSVSGFDVKKLHAEFISMRRFLATNTLLSKKIQSEIRFIRFPEYSVQLSLPKNNGRFVLASGLELDHFEKKNSFKDKLNNHKKDLQELSEKIALIPIKQQEKN